MRKDEKHANAFHLGLSTHIECNKNVEVHNGKGNRSGSYIHSGLVKLVKFHEGNINLPSLFFPAQITRQISTTQWKDQSQNNHRYEINHTLLLFPHQYPPFGIFRVWKCLWCLEKLSFSKGEVYILLLIKYSFPIRFRHVAQMVQDELQALWLMIVQITNHNYEQQQMWCFTYQTALLNKSVLEILHKWSHTVNKLLESESLVYTG